MLELAQQISYYLSVVDGGATSKLVGYGQSLASVGMIAMTAKASVESMIAPLTAVANAWSGREQQINNISRSLRQYEFVGQSIIAMNKDIADSMPGANQDARAAEFTRRYQSQFNEARQFSHGIIGEMNRMAAILPGEMNDYMQSFSQNMPHLARVEGMTVGRAAHLTSYLTAGGVSAGIDAGQSARDLMQALTTGAHIVDRSWTEVWSQYARIKGPGGQMRHLDTAGFNRLKLEDKVRVLEDIAQQLQPMMDATGDSWDALIGTFQSAKHEMYLTMTEPLFDATKRMLSTLNASLVNIGPRIAQVGRFFSGLVAGKILGLADRFKGLDQTILKSTGTFMRWTQLATGYYRRASSMAGGIYGRVSGAARSAYGTAAEALRSLGVGSVITNAVPFLLARIAMGVFGPAGYIITNVVGRLFANGKIWGLLESAGNVVRALLPALGLVGGALYRIADAALGGLATIFGDYVPPLLNAFANEINLVNTVFPAFVMGLLGTTIPLRTIAGAIWTLITTFFRLEMAIYRVVWGTFGQLIGAINSAVYATILPVLQLVGNAFGWLLERIVALSNFISRWLHLAAPGAEGAAAAGATPEQLQMPSWMYDLQKTMADMGKSVSDMNRTGRGSNQPRPHTSQDFRYSRFEITQKFAEGFDPDRVASAFASDLSAMAEQRLDSGFAPAFASP